MDNSFFCALTKIQVFGSTVLKELDKQLEREDSAEANQNVPVPQVSDLLGEHLDPLTGFQLTFDPEIYLKR